MASRTFEWPEKAQNGLGWFQKYYFPVLYEAQLHIFFGTYTIFRKFQIMHNVYWDHSWEEFDRRLYHITFNYWHDFPVLPITLTVAWQPILVSCNAKVIQLLCCKSSCKGANGTLHKWLCWEFGVSNIVFVLLQLSLDIYLTCCGTILYLTNQTLYVSCLTLLATLAIFQPLGHRTTS